MTEPTKHDWDLYGNPTIPGWYPVIWCIEAREGCFPSGGYWDGKAWSALGEGSLVGPEFIFAFLPKLCSGYKEADDTAHEKDPNW